MYMQDRFYSHIESKCILTFKDVIEIIFYVYMEIYLYVKLQMKSISVDIFLYSVYVHF